MGDWIEIRNRLFDLAEEVDALTEDAARLIGSVPIHGEQGIKQMYDPRKSTMSAAKFVAGIDYVASSLRSRGGLIQPPAKPSSDESPTEGAGDG